MYSIAIDGPSSSGKSSLAKGIANRLNILHLNTGELYRAVGLYAYENDMDKDGDTVFTKDELSDILNNIHIEVKFKNGGQITFLNGVDVTAKLHSSIVSDYSSRVSQIQEVRDHVLALQRDIAKNNNVVVEGRDITSHVLPDSKYKFFVTASTEVRAKRRYDEFIAKGENLSFDEVLADIKERDIRDTTRKICPLVKVADAILIDNSDMNLEECIDLMLSYIKEK